MPSAMDPRDKINEKMEQKFKVGGATKNRLTPIFAAVSTTPGFVTFPEWKKAVEVGLGNALSDDECGGLFHFYLEQIDDPVLKEYGAVPIDLIIADLTGAQQQYGTLFNSGDEPVKANLKSRGNLPSQVSAHTCSRPCGARTGRPFRIPRSVPLAPRPPPPRPPMRRSPPHPPCRRVASSAEEATRRTRTVSGAPPRATRRRHRLRPCSRRPPSSARVAT